MVIKHKQPSTAKDVCSRFASMPTARHYGGSLPRLACVYTEVEVSTFWDVRHQRFWMQPVSVRHGERPIDSIKLQGDLFTLKICSLRATARLTTMGFESHP